LPKQAHSARHLATDENESSVPNVNPAGLSFAGTVVESSPTGITGFADSVSAAIAIDFGPVN